MKELLSGNEAIARGAYEAGVRVAVGYPGTPSTEILENVQRYKDKIYCEWSPNEKVAFETAAGACLTGARSIVTMKHVGLNVAADPLMTLTYVGTEGGFVAIVADDPGMHSSQNEQDTRNYARFAKIPILEPSDSEEARDFLVTGLDISEKFKTPVILRTTTRVSHSRSLVELKERIEHVPQGFKKNPPQYVPIPAWARPMRQRVEKRLLALTEESSNSPLNRIEWGERQLGIIAVGIAYQYTREIFPEASILKLGWCYPYPDKLIREFAAGVKRLLVVEELDDFVEEHVKALGIPCDGKNIVPNIGELSPLRLMEIRAKIEGTAIPEHKPIKDASLLPPRPPVLCPSCPHRSIFAALGRFDVVVTGDIGCYSLGVSAPLNRMDTILCMGGGISMAHGMKIAGETKRVVGIVGDSTFFHSGITGLLDIGYNKSAPVIIVADNRITAMTGHQDNPGSGKTLMGDSAYQASITDFAKACGIKRIFTIDPHNFNAMVALLKESFETPEPTVIIALSPCVVDDRSALRPALKIDPTICKHCKMCLKVGCPAIESMDNTIKINPLLCGGCKLCQQICKFGAIS